MRIIVNRWKHDGTKMLGTLQVIVSGALATNGLIPAHHMPYFLWANIVLGALTIKRGYTNSKGTP